MFQILMFIPRHYLSRIGALANPVQPYVFVYKLAGRNEMCVADEMTFVARCCFRLPPAGIIHSLASLAQSAARLNLG